MTGLSELNAAQRLLVKQCGSQDGAAATISALTGKHCDQRRISERLRPEAQSSLPVHYIYLLEDAIRHDRAGFPGGWPPVTRMLAAAHGFALVKLPEATAGASDWLVGMGALARQAGDVTAEIAKALADDVIDEREREVICGKIRQAQESLAALAVLAGAR